MPSSLTHAVAAAAISATFYRPGVPKRVWIAGILCSMLPDIDVIGFRVGIPYGDFWGHRGFTHSLAFAALLAAILTVVVRARAQISSFALFSYLFLATASHGLLDAMTNGGLGVAFFSPFSNRRYFFPWRPIRVSPIGVSRFFGAKAVAILHNEILWVWLPSLVVIAAVMVSLRFRERSTAAR
ncbi:MAG TPA: metal-dependent hydrolase [Candidatus Sulfotelmatobacter sp.]|nr:metal-dependent hydrolase [Candidatus Sulfotelmatobacter sp.]